MNSLKLFVKHRYGSVSEAGRQLQVSPQAVGQWIQSAPRNMLKYMPEVCVQCNVSPQYFLNVIMNTEAELMQRNMQNSEQPEPQS